MDSTGCTYWLNPKLEAYRYTAFLQSQGRRTALAVENGEYKVESMGLLPLIFCKAEGD